MILSAAAAAADAGCCCCRLGSEMGSDVMLVVAEQEGQTVAAALNVVGSHCVYGRNWGSIGGRDFKNLHFEVCYYQVR
jgi:predicted N-acyltransferase